MKCTYFSCPELAYLTGYSRMQIQRLARARLIPSMRVTRGGHFRFNNDVILHKWITRYKKHLKSNTKKMLLCLFMIFARHVTISGNSVPTILTQEIDTEITVPDKATVVIGALITDSTTRDVSSVPGLGDIWPKLWPLGRE